MKHLRKFNEGVDEDVEYLEMMLAELGEHDFMDLVYIKSHVANIAELQRVAGFFSFNVGRFFHRQRFTS